MDVEMAGGDGLTATARLLELVPEARVLILTMFDLDEYVHEALRVGAAGFLIKTTEPHALVAAVKECAVGETTLGPSIVRRLVESYVSSRPVSRPPGADDLTDASATCCVPWHRA
jgi:DNA-binding NarL/FixJ family response regulator